MTDRRIAKLLQGYVNGLRPEEKDYKAWDTEIKGFHVRVLPSGTKTYMYTYRLAGKQCAPKIGRHGNITASQARAMAKDYAAKAAQGVDIQGGINASKEQVKREKVSTLGAFLEELYKPWTETNHKRGTETMRVLNKEFAHLHCKRLADITQLDARKYEQDKSKAGLSKSTIDRQVRDLKTALSKAAEWDIIENSPLAGMKQGKADKNGRVRYLSETEENQLRGALDARQAKQRIERQHYNQWRHERRLDPLPLIEGRYTDYLEPLVVLALNTGLRRGELFNLEWADINLKGRLLTVQGGGAKSGQTRHIPLNDEAFGLLVAWRSQAGGNVLVFPSPVTSYRLDNINKSWRNLVNAAGVEDFRFHDLRHHFASSLVMAGADLNTVRELLGHASLDMTLRYSHLAPEHKAAAVALLNK